MDGLDNTICDPKIFKLNSKEELERYILKILKERSYRSLKSVLDKCPKIANYNIFIHPFEATPLHIAALYKWVEGAKVLFEYGADPNSRDIQNRTPLHYAVLIPPVRVKNIVEETIKVIDLLVSYGADVNTSDDAGLTPLHYALSEHHVDVIKRLIDLGADLYKKDNLGEAPIDYIIKKSRDSEEYKELILYINRKTRTERSTHD